MAEVVCNLITNGTTWKGEPTSFKQVLYYKFAPSLSGGYEITDTFPGEQLWGMKLPVEQARRVLAMVQRYADACYLVTERHKKAVRALQSIEEVEAYDYTTGYPEKLVLGD